MAPLPLLPPLLPPLSGEPFVFTGPAGQLCGYVAGSGPPLVLIHSINAAASAAELRPLYEHYQQTRTVFALDLPGFGLSERSDRVYTPRLMTDAVHALVAQVRARLVTAPVDALALSLGCEFLARAAAEDRGAFRRLALVSPTGFSGRRQRRGPPGSTYAMPLLYRLMRGPGWGGALFRLLTRPAVIRYFLKRTWGSAQIDEALWRYDILAARQPGAEYAPLYFLSGGLFSADIHSIYDALTLPVWLSHGVRGDFTDYRGTALIAGRSNWRISELATGALPFFELPGEFFAALDSFLAH
jgi:pimeloyl-ACP methyl ester carboxylesterase